MKPHRVLDCITTPDGWELVLYQRGDDFLIQVDGHDLMSSRIHGSEEELARLALSTLGPRPAPRILIGGLGMGFTLRAALDRLDALHPQIEASLVVAEFFPAVVAWNRGPLAHLADSPLDDPRVRIEVGDVAEVLDASPGAFDVILLDVDNGPDALTLDSNRHLYSSRGLGRLHRALASGGVLAVWSAFHDPAFSGRLVRAGFAVNTCRVRARGSGKGAWYVIFLARRT